MSASCWTPTPFSPDTSERPTDWLELLAIHRQANEIGWGAESYLAVADWVQRHRPRETGIISFWRRIACGLGVAQ
ncbi:hypothetical protein KBY66_03310 [Synechococcus sp. Tobar12-5m-g]|uniref:hypothetical protein n=1 Tax=unclassified Synechococcus TaxID=2626047 RepID=UPI0020CC1B29|nr:MULTISPECIES: hypothetical protein [unclassified Synechococcus]MCP9771656.1 hypothetical protein [Synechococcus sp. Tobar12-5m-g]MCP9872597.1 hypothetical protein [Synechococcus sp. Cruz CV-v-12]